MSARVCRICGVQFRTLLKDTAVCLKCQDKLPKCDTCHITLGRCYGFAEDFARTVGGIESELGKFYYPHRPFDICTSCNYEIINKGFLHIESARWSKGERFLLPDGQIVGEMPAR